MGAPLPRSIPLRLGLIGAGLLFFQTGFSIWLSTASFWHAAPLALSAVAWIGGTVCFVLATVQRVPRAAQWLILAGAIGSLWGSAFLQWQNTTPFTTSHTDNEMIGEYAAEALKHGYNPYSWNFSDATRVYRDRGALVTTFLDGSPQNRVTYPALPTLLLLAFGPIGLGQSRFVSLVFHSILLILLFVGTPARYRPFYVLALFAIRDFFPALTGIQDIVWSTLLVAMLLAWERPTLRAVLFGLACAYRQQPWVLAPFLLIHLWNSEGDGSQRRSRILHFVAVGLGTFLLINLPFMLWDTRGWALGVFEPTYAAFNITSHGFGTVAQYNLLPLPRTFYTALQLSLFALMIIVHWRHPLAVGESFWIFPAILFWVFYRGLANYWLYWIPPLLVALTQHKWCGAVQIETRTRWNQTMYFIVVALAGNLLLAAFFLSRPPTISVSLTYPLESTDGYGVDRLSLGVTNQSAQLFRPRFAVQHDGSQPLPWDIEYGPDVLKAGESARYVVSTYSYPFSIVNGAQLVISDAGGSYALRAVKDIPGEPTFGSADLIINPSFTVWQPYAQIPFGWSWQPPQGEGIPLRTESAVDKTAVALSVSRGTARLSQTITFPDSFSIRVYPTAGGSDPLRSAYGLEFDDGQHKLWVLFGDGDAHGTLEPNVGYTYQRTALHQWSKQEIKPAELYAMFGWELPPYTVRDSQGLEFSARQVKFSLMVSGSDVTGIFGPIVQDPHFVSPDALVEAAIEHPDVYYVNLGDEYSRQRNDGLAEGAYRQAISFNKGNAYAHSGLGRALANQGRCVEAQQQLDAATQLDPGIQDPLGGIITCR